MNYNLKKLNNLIANDRLQAADLIVWLQGDRMDRGPKSLELFKKGWGKKILISGNDVRLGSARPGEDNISLEKMIAWLKARGVKAGNIIVDKNSFNTRDQAINTIGFAKKHGMRSLVIVGSWPYYQFRVFLTFLKAAQELDWTGRVINQFAVIPLNKKPGGRDETSKVLMQKEANKLQLYKHHLVSIKEAIKYLEHKNPKLTLRKATFKDAKFLWALRNDPEVRKNSFTEDKVPWENHVKWLKSVLKNPQRFLYVLLDRNKRGVGQIRFDQEATRAEISIALHKNVRHKGYGVTAIQAASDYFLRSHGSVKTILAQVKPENKASVIAFLRAGFVEQSQKDGHLNLTYSLK